MRKQERKIRRFDPEPKDFRRAIHWLWNQRVPRNLIADIFQKSQNLISVSAFNEENFRSEHKNLIELPPHPDITLAEDEFLPGSIPKSTAAMRRMVEEVATQFWRRVRSLDGLLAYGTLLQKLSKREKENTTAYRLQARLKHLTAETYVHAGYAKSAIHFSEEAIALYLKLYDDTRSKLDLEGYAKASLLLSRARIQREEWDSAWRTLSLAAEAFGAANVPVDPELLAQRAMILAQQDNIADARKLYLRAYNAFPAHREYLGYGTDKHAHYDVGQRPLGILYGDFERSLQSLEVARSWPAGDIHHAINLNAAIATSLVSDSAASKHFAEENFTKAQAASAGFGHQMTVTRLLELTSRIPKSLHATWVRFALQYNAYRNR